MSHQVTQPIRRLRNINQAKRLETEEQDVGSHVVSKVLKYYLINN